MGPTNNVNSQIFNDNEIRNQVWNHTNKKPFILTTESLIQNWNLPINPYHEHIKYPVIPPWYDITAHISLNLKTPTNKSLGTTHNYQTSLETIYEKYKDAIHIYTDGSKVTDNSTGAAFYEPKSATRSNWRLHDSACIVSAELSAINVATSWLLTQNNPKQAVILTDSKTSLHLIKHRIPKRYIHSITRIHENLTKLKNTGWEITLQWIPSHCGIKGNELVDHHANNGRLLQEITYPIELINLQNLVKKHKKTKWQQEWDLNKQNTNYGLIKPTLGDWPWYRTNNRTIDVIITKLRLEKVHLNKYLNKIKLSDTELCNQCNLDEVEDIEHYLLHCPKYRIQRDTLITNLRKIGINTISINTLLGNPNTNTDTKRKIVKILIMFLRSTKRLTP